MLPLSSRHLRPQLPVYSLEFGLTLCTMDLKITKGIYVFETGPAKTGTNYIHFVTKQAVLEQNIL